MSFVQKGSFNRRVTFLPVVIAGVFTAALACAAGTTPAHADAHNKTFNVQKTEAQWRKQLTANQFHVLREQGTERAFSGKYWDHKGHGTYVCAGCGQPLFASKDKFKSGTGWPSYTRAVNDKSVDVRRDKQWGMTRTEILCSNCGGHLGHVFSDGPAPTGQRYCVNSASLVFQDGSAKKATSPATKQAPKASAVKK